MGDIYVELARQSLTSYIKDGKKLQMPEGLPEEQAVMLTAAAAASIIEVIFFMFSTPICKFFTLFIIFQL